MLELSARPFSEISAPEPQATGKVSEENFLVKELFDNKITENRAATGAVPKI